jgi:hypothetical protein
MHSMDISALLKRRYALAAAALAVLLPFYATAQETPQGKDPRAGFETNCSIALGPAKGFPPAAGLQDAYECASNHMNYGASGNAIAQNYMNWQRRDNFPVKSPAHGNHYVAIYANDIAAAEPMQDVIQGIKPGSTIATPVFSIDDNGAISVGPLLILEKMQSGFNPTGGDWRYTLISPDGQIIGVNAGEGKTGFNFCRQCSGTFADSIFTSLLHGEPAMAPLKPRPMIATAPPASPRSVPSAPVRIAPTPQPNTMPQPEAAPAPKPAPQAVLDPNAPVLDPSKAGKAAPKKAPPKKKSDKPTKAEEAELEKLVTKRRDEPKS